MLDVFGELISKNQDVKSGMGEMMNPILKKNRSTEAKPTLKKKPSFLA